MTEQQAATTRAKGAANVWIDGDVVRIRFTTPGDKPYAFEFGFDPQDTLWLGEMIVARSTELIERQVREALNGETGRLRRVVS